MIARATYQKLAYQRAIYRGLHSILPSAPMRLGASAVSGRTRSASFAMRAALGFLTLFMVSAFGEYEGPMETAPMDAALTADAPIAASFVATADIALEGYWQGAFIADATAPVAASINIRRGPKPGQYILDINGRAFTAHTSTLRGLKFLNIRLLTPSQGRPGRDQQSKRPSYVLALYSISGSGSLSLRTMPTELVREAVLAGRLPGRYWAANQQSAPSLRNTDSVTLRQFLRQLGPARVFSDHWGRFRRAAPPVNNVASIEIASEAKRSSAVTHIAANATRR